MLLPRDVGLEIDRSASTVLRAMGYELHLLEIALNLPLRCTLNFLFVLRSDDGRWALSPHVPASDGR